RTQKDAGSADAEGRCNCKNQMLLQRPSANAQPASFCVRRACLGRSGARSLGTSGTGCSNITVPNGSKAALVNCSMMSQERFTMTKAIRRTLALAAIGLTLVSADALAQGKGHGKEKHKDKDRRDDVVRVESRGSVAVPPGLAKKPGHMPPGQYKKLYPTQGVTVLRDVFGRHGYTVVRTSPYGQSQYVY